MSGVDPSVSSTSTLPPSEPEPGAPPPTLRGAPPPPAHEHDARDLLVSVGVHGGAELVAGALESSGLVLGSGGILTVGGTALGAVASTAGWAFALVEMGHAVLSAPAEGTRAGFLEAALGGRGWESSRGWCAGIGAVMLDLSDTERAALAARFPEGHLRRDFEAAVENAREAARDHAPGWDEAREEYRAIFRSWSDGHAAAIGGWDTPGRGEVFERSRAEMSAYLEAHPDEAAVLRAHYRADVREGFLAADAGTVDAHRYELDAGYRAGVEHQRRVEAEGSEALSRERHDIVGVSASSFTLGTFAA